MPACACRLKCVACLSDVVHDAGRQAELGVVGERERLVVVLRADHARDRAEDLLAVDAHRVRRLGEERGRQVVAVGRALQPLAADDELRALALADLEVLQVLLELALVDDRPDVGAGEQRVVDAQRRELVGHRRDEAVVDAVGDDEARRRRAALAGREERALHGDVHRGRQVGVVEHDQRVLAAHLELHLRHARDAPWPRSRGRCRTRAGEAQRRRRPGR